MALWASLLLFVLSASAADKSATWAFRPIQRTHSQSSIDAFLLQKLREKGLTPAPRADRRTLIRRATFDLTGLPPTPDEISGFLKDPAPTQQAFAKLVDRLLASPRYGERWGRHWLDVVRYADTSGYSNDFERPTAWRYRDYVVRSFNQDKPYNRFVMEQVAGDEMEPRDPERLVATGFLRMGPWEQTAMSVAAVTRQAWLDDVTNITATAFLGLPAECARCHDHKFDPIPTRDYYRLQAVFAPSGFADVPAPFAAGEARADFEAGRARQRELLRRTQAKLDEYRDLVRKRLTEKGGTPSAAALNEAVRTMDLLSTEEQERLKVYRKRLELYERSMKRYDAVAFTVSSEPPDSRAAYDADSRRGTRNAAATETWPPETFVLVGGNLQSPGDKVGPGFFSAVAMPANGNGNGHIPDSGKGRRLALAKWIASPQNPLTARVLVNRVWQYHFGRGLVATPNNFGLLGGMPSHPELLDWLAAYFIDHGWRIKDLHRVMMLSAAYQRSGRPPQPERLATADPENKLLGYFAPRRLDAEEIRDSILAVAGELSFDGGGPGTFPEMNEDVANQPLHIMGTLAPAYRPSPTRRERHRRTVFTFQQRNLPDPFLEVLNGAPMNETCERRKASTIPTQAFSLLNSTLARDMSLALAVRARDVAGVFRLAFGRAPTADEARKSAAHVAKMTAHHRANPPPPVAREPVVRSITSEFTGTEVRIDEEEDPAAYEENLHPSQVPPQTRALADLALVLINSNEFLYVY